MGQSPERSVDSPLQTITAKADSGIAVPVLAPFIGEHANASNQRNMAADEPLRTICAQVKGGHFSVVAPTLLSLRGTSQSHLNNGHTVEQPLSTISAGGLHHGLVAGHITKFNTGAVGYGLDEPMATITAAGSNQQLVTAYMVKYYGTALGVRLNEPMHTLPTKDRMGLVQITQVSIDCLAQEHRARAKQCAALLHEHLPENFPTPADMVLVGEWVLVDITLRMLKPPELFKAQSFPASYIIHEIPDPKLLFVNGKQVVGNPLLIPRIPLTGTAQVRMCGNSVAPAQAEALARANFAHEALIYGRKAA